MATTPKPRSTRLLVVILVSISLATITLDYRQGERGPLAGLGRTAYAVMAPLQRAVTNATRPIADFFSGIVHLPSLQRENDRLKQEIEILKTQIATGATLQAQLEMLRKTLDLQRSYTAPSIAALVIGGVPSNFEWSITIGRGASAGVAVGDPVIVGGADAAGGILVGHVIRVSDDVSVVELIIDRGSAVAGKLQHSGETGIVQGQGDADMTMNFVPPGTEIPPDESVVTAGYQAPSGEPGLYPPGILIGQVSRTLPPANQVDAFIQVRPAVDLSNLDVVLVLETGARG